MSKKYAIGVDYSTESGRAVLVDLSNGDEIADHVTPYPHNVIDQDFPESGVRLGHDWALQHPGDYIEVLKRSIPAVLKQSNIDSSDAIGIGIDFTACTMLPVDERGIPLYFGPEFKNMPHSWVKLWKHLPLRMRQTELMQQLLRPEESFLSRYGEKISLE